MTDRRLTSENTVRAERALVGGVLIDPAVYDLVSLDSSHFSHPMAAMAWEAIASLRADGVAIDPVTITSAIDPAPGTQADGMMPWLSQCAIDTPTADNCEFYAEIVREGHVTRAALVALSDIQQRAGNGELAGDELVGAALQALSRIDTEQPDAAITIGEAIRDRFQQLEQMVRDRAEGRVTLAGAPTGVEKLDRMLGGFRWGLACIVCGRPGMGKSSLALGVADANTGVGHGVHEFSLEDTRDTRADRAVSRLSGVSSQSMQRGQLTYEDMYRVREAAGILWKRKNWLVDDRSGISAEEIVRSVRRRARDNGTQVVIVDYLTLLRRPSHVKSELEWHTHSMNVLADAAKQDNMAYVVLAQLNREVERRPDKRPLLSDLRQTGEERAKQVIALYRGSYYGAPKKGVDYEPPDELPPEGDDWEGRVDLLVLKNQNGETGIVRARWDGPTTTIS